MHREAIGSRGGWGRLSVGVGMKGRVRRIWGVRVEERLGVGDFLEGDEALVLVRMDERKKERKEKERKKMWGPNNNCGRNNLRLLMGGF
ncbi:hypothetical protein CEXT_596031 [Caerostris extrusa]|uniref:Uncharacterized protein n=1 Tax=Caerostris extrusa TaxID=172846 RepID=A0AAV4P4W2_CAEEX|nr:hypothetical protein CEXT_596031 [Caerostris extrusa]